MNTKPDIEELFNPTKGHGVSKKVLVVDNHPTMLRFMTRLLEKEGHHVLTAQDGVSALEVLGDHVPDVAFIDLVMPNISGDKLCRIIRGMPGLEHLHIIILSAIAAEQAIDINECGADSCIAKGPFDDMARHILDALNEVRPQRGSQEKVIGLEHVHYREITRELLTVKRHLELILHSLAEGIIELNQDLKILYANPVALSLAAVPEEKLLGSYFVDLFDENGRKQIRTMLAASHCSVSGRNGRDCVLSLNGKEITIKISHAEEETKTIVVLNDVTRQRRMEAQFREAQKMEAIGTLAGGIAHDFNNLLMTIQGNVSLMLFTSGEDHPHHERLKNIEKQVDRGAKLTSQLLGYARRGKYEVKPFNVNHLVEETVDTLGSTRKEVAIHMDLARNLLPLEADEGQIEQVLLNLCINAADAMPGGGHLTLRSRNANSEDLRRIGERLGGKEPSDYIVLTVTDTGTGMDAEILEHIFEPFFTTKERGQGTGLGLAAAYGIVTSHGGFIDVASKKGKGTTFTIYLPADPGAETTTPRATETEKILKGDETILLVDDESMILDLGRQLLNAMGYEVLTAKDGNAAIDLFKTRIKEIDLVILDIIMPGMNGGTAFERMKEIDPAVKVLLSSGYSIEGQARKLLERGCHGFLQKPFDLAGLSQSVREILDK